MSATPTIATPTTATTSPSLLAVASAAAASTNSSSSGKSCSACHRTLHVSAFSGTQAKAPAKTRKCMECIVMGKSSAIDLTSDATPTASATNSSTTASASTTAQPKKKVKANTPGAIARERAAARQTTTNSSSSTSSASALPTDAKSAAALLESLTLNSKSTTAGSKAGAKSKPDSIFSAPRKSKDQSGKKSLLDADEEWFLPEAEAALEEIFRRFDSAHQPPSTNTPRLDLYWTLADIQSFARAANGKEFGTEELMEIQDNLEHNEAGQLTCQGFLDFYHLQTTSHPDETWKDLAKLGYNSDLKLTPKP